MNIVHIHTTSDQVDNLPVVNGQLIVLDDVSRFYYDMNGVRHNVTSGDGITIDTALSSTSRNPVENRVITSALGDKADTSALGSAAAKDVPESGDASLTEVVMGDDSRLSDARPASDVYSWAKAETKPSYTAAEVGAIPSTAKGANSGVAELDENGKVPTSQLPSYVDDVLEYSSQSEFPATGETGKIYVDTTTNLTYRWSGSAYVEISPSLALGETSSTAYRGDRGKTAYDHSQLTSGNPHNVTAADVGLGDVGNFKAVSTVASQGLTDTEKSNARANIGAGTSSLTIGTDASSAAAGNHTHSLSLASDSGTSSISLAASTKYKLTAGGSTYVFTTPPNTTYANVSTSAAGLAPKVTDTSKYLKGDGTWATPTDTNNRRGFWGTCATAAATAEKAVTLGSTAGWELVAGTIVGVKFTNTNTAGTAKLNVNSSGAKQIWYNGAAYTGTEARITGWAGHVIYYMYDGTYWCFLNNDQNYVNTNTTYSAGTGLSLSSTTFSLATSGASAGSYGPSANVDGTNGTTMSVPYITVDTYGRVTSIANKTYTSRNTNTDTKVTSVGNHYAPAEDTSAKLSADASSTTAATWASTSLVTGVDIKRDAKGHVVGVAVDSIQMPANPNSDTKNTAGSTDSSSKLFLIGATSQAANPQTYSHDTAYVGTDGCLYSGGSKVLTSYTNTVPSAYCDTAAATAAKTATCTNYNLLSKSYLHVIVVNTNTSASAITLNVNGKGAKAIYINGTASSASNYTLTKGSYIVYYDGTNYYFRTDGKLTGVGMVDVAGSTAKFLRGDGTWQTPTNTTYANVSTSAAGLAPTVTSTAKYLRGDGTWQTPTNTTYTGANGVSLSGTTFSNSGVRSIATGTANGKINVNTNGTTADVAVKGLGTAAYTASTAYSASGHTHTLSLATDSGTSSITLAASTKYKLTAGGSTYVFTTPPNSTYTVGSATLTIQKNGTTVKTFSANATSNVTANITTDTWTSTAAVTSSGTVAFSSLNDTYGYDLYCENKLVSITDITKSGSGTSTKLTYTLSGAATGDVCKLRILI